MEIPTGGNIQLRGVFCGYFIDHIETYDLTGIVHIGNRNVFANYSEVAQVFESCITVPIEDMLCMVSENDYDANYSPIVINLKTIWTSESGRNRDFNKIIAHRSVKPDP